MTTSVALCTFNGEKFIEEQLHSILSQEISVDEIIICDDASSDDTWVILEKYKKKHPETIQIFAGRENLGYVLNFEKALSHCKGDVIFLCDQDDIWYSNKVLETLQFFEKNSDIGLVAHNLELSDPSKYKTFWDLKSFKPPEKTLYKKKLLDQLLITGNVFPGMSLAIKKELLLQYLPLQKVDSVMIHDFEMIVKSLRDEKFGIMDKVLGIYRQHDAQSIGYKEGKKPEINNQTKVHLFSQHYRQIKKYVEIFSLNESIAEQYRKEVKEKYATMLKEIPFFSRLLFHLKNKFYYKIIHF